MECGPACVQVTGPALV